MLKSSKSGTNLSNLLAESRTSATVVPGNQTTVIKKSMRKSATKALLSTQQKALLLPSTTPTLKVDLTTASTANYFPPTAVGTNNNNSAS